MIIPTKRDTMHTTFDYQNYNSPTHQVNHANFLNQHDVHQVNNAMLPYAYQPIKSELAYYSPASSVELCNTSNNSQHSSNSITTTASNLHANDLLMQNSTDKLWNSLDEMSNESYSSYHNPTNHSSNPTTTTLNGHLHSSANNQISTNQFNHQLPSSTGANFDNQTLAYNQQLHAQDAQYNLYQKQTQLQNQTAHQLVNQHHVNRMLLHMPPTPPNSEPGSPSQQVTNQQQQLSAQQHNNPQFAHSATAVNNVNSFNNYYDQQQAQQAHNSRIVDFNQHVHQHTHHHTNIFMNATAFNHHPNLESNSQQQQQQSNSSSLVNSAVNNFVPSSNSTSNNLLMPAAPLTNASNYNSIQQQQLIAQQQATIAQQKATAVRQQEQQQQSIHQHLHQQPIMSRPIFKDAKDAKIKLEQQMPSHQLIRQPIKQLVNAASKTYKMLAGNAANLLPINGTKYSRRNNPELEKRRTHYCNYEGTFFCFNEFVCVCELRKRCLSRSLRHHFDLNLDVDI